MIGISSAIVVNVVFSCKFMIDVVLPEVFLGYNSLTILIEITYEHDDVSSIFIHIVKSI